MSKTQECSSEQAIQDLWKNASSEEGINLEFEQNLPSCLKFHSEPEADILACLLRVSNPSPIIPLSAYSSESSQVPFLSGCITLCNTLYVSSQATNMSL